jgi:PAS domain S-box-containing protein
LLYIFIKGFYLSFNNEQLKVLDSGEIVFSSDFLIISETDENGVITYVNQNFLDISGAVEEDLLNKPHSIVRHPDTPRQVFKDMWGSIQDKGFWGGFIKDIGPNDTYYWVYSTIMRRIGKNGRPTYLSLRTKPNPDDVAKVNILYKQMD